MIYHRFFTRVTRRVPLVEQDKKTHVEVTLTIQDNNIPMGSLFGKHGSCFRNYNDCVIKSHTLDKSSTSTRIHPGSYSIFSFLCSVLSIIVCLFGSIVLAIAMFVALLYWPL